MTDRPPPPQTATPATARPWLARLHPSLFGMALGLLGLSGAWHRLQPAGVDAAGPLAEALRHGAVLRQELRHSVQGALLALMPVALLMAVALVAGRWPQTRDTLLPLALVVLAGQDWMAWRVVADLSTGKTPPELVTPTLYLPTVPGGFVGAIALQALGFHGWATLLMGMGLGAWALLEMRILNRLFAGPLPLALRPTLGIEMAPAAVGSLAACVLWPELPADAVLLGLGVASGPVLAVLTRWRYWSEVPFTVGFWSFSFPLAAFASTTVEAVRRGDWPLSVAVFAVVVASAVMAYLLARTLALLVRGRLLPPV